MTHIQRSDRYLFLSSTGIVIQKNYTYLAMTTTIIRIYYINGGSSTPVCGLKEKYDFYSISIARVNLK